MSVSEAVRVVDVERPFEPASPVQRQMWVVDRMDPAACVYNEHLAFWIDGPLDPTALEDAWNELVVRHEVLRMVFAVRDGELFSAVLPEHRCVFERATFDDDRDATAWGGALVERRYDITAAPPMVIGLARTAAERHLFVIGFHHAVMDAGSIGLLFDELAGRYRAHLLGDPQPCVPEQVGYTDYVAWSRSAEFADRVDELIPEVVRTLRDPATAVAEIPGDRQRSAVKSTRGSLAEQPFPAGIVPRLRTYAAGHRVTPFQVLLAGMGALVHRYAGADDIVLGVGSSGRPPAYAQTVGPFSCVVPVRLAVPGDAAFEAVAEGARDAALRLESTQFVPFGRVVSEVVEGRDPSRTPLVQIVFNAPPLHFAEDTLDGCRLTQARLPRNRSRFDLLVNLEWHGDDIVGTAEYDSSLFDHASVTGLLGRLGELVDAAILEPDCPLDELAVPGLPLADRLPRSSAGSTGSAGTGSTGAGPAGTLLERHLVGHARDLLDNPAIEPSDDFFAVGGHSMLAARLTQRLSEEFDADVGLLAVFEHPVLADLAAVLDSQFPEFETILAAAADLTADEIAALTASEPAPESGTCLETVTELSPHEEPFWLLEQFAPGSAVNTLTLRVPGRGPIDVEAFAAALGDVADRHEILRTSYHAGEQASGRRLVHESVPVEVEEIPRFDDGGAVGADGVAEREARTGFALESAPLLRATVVHTGSETFEIVLSFHHLVMDYWGVTKIMLPDLAGCYRARLGSAHEAGPERAGGYRAALLRELEWRESADADAQRRYWAERLDGLAPTALPTDRPRPETPEFGGATVSRRLGPELRRRLADHAGARRTTTFAVLAAATAAALRQRTGTDEAFLLCPVENRREAADTAVMGTFVNLVALRYRFGPGQSLRDLVEQSRTVVLGAYANQSLPIADALREAGQESVISSGQGRYCVLNVFSADTGLRLEGCELGAGAIVPHPAASTDLELSVTESDDGLDVDLKYRPSLWEPASMTGLLDSIEAVLVAILADDGRPVGGQAGPRP